MQELEITEIPPLSPGEQSIVDFHSVVNVVNVLNCELLVLGLTLANDENLFARSMAACQEVMN